MAGPPTAGTSIVAGTAVSVTGVQYGNVLIASGAVTSLSAITKTALQNGEIQVNYSSNYDSWKANKPTSKTISGRGGKLIEARVGNRKVKLRVDWEPTSGTNGDGVFQVQSGSGKSGYSLDEYIEVNTISGRKSIEDWVNTNRQLRKLDTSTKEEIINRIFKGYRIYYGN